MGIFGAVQGGRRKGRGDIGMVWKSDRRIYVSIDRSRIVEESAAGGKVLLTGVGGTVSEADCQRYGLGSFAVAAPVQETPEEELARLQAEAEALVARTQEILDAKAAEGEDPKGESDAKALQEEEDARVAAFEEEEKVTAEVIRRESLTDEERTAEDDAKAAEAPKD